MTQKKSQDYLVEKKDDWSDHWESYAKSASENPAQKMRHDLVLNAILGLNKKPDLLLDIGSGQGDFLEKASGVKVAVKYIGFELSDAGVAISSEKVKQASFYQVDLFSPPDFVLKFKNTADVLVCCDVIEHVDNPELFCKYMMEYLRPGGYLFLTVPGGPMSAFDRYIGHRVHYGKKSMRVLLESAGYSVREVKMAGFPFFNLYRLVVLLRGSRLIQDAEASGTSSSSRFANLVMKIFNFLFKFNIHSVPYGWQVFAIARKP